MSKNRVDPLLCQSVKDGQTHEQTNKQTSALSHL